MLAGAQLHTIEGKNGFITAEQVQAAFRPTDDHYPQTGLICLENTHNRAGGTIYPLEEIQRISQLARGKGIPIHLDGARLWNASVATGISIKEYCRHFDSVMMCFSKGLGAPVGSVVAGSKEFVKRAHFYRKAYGGGIRQGGILAATALYALEYHWPLLKEDHRRVRHLAEGIVHLSGVSVKFDTVQTNIFIFEVVPQKISADSLVKKLAENGVLMFTFGPTRIRAVTHLEISDEDIAYAIDAFKKLLQ
jgi:threonine aldolase